MHVRTLLLTVALLYAHSAVAADIVQDEPHQAPERWGDLAPEYGSCDERTRLSGVGAPWVAAGKHEDEVAPEVGRRTAQTPQAEESGSKQ